MSDTKFKAGTAHSKVPTDLEDMLGKSDVMAAAWQDITPLARNEFLCWIEDAKKAETRSRRIEIARDKLERGERRPCCWVGCIHRTDKAMSASQRWVTARKSA